MKLWQKVVAALAFTVAVIWTLVVTDWYNDLFNPEEEKQEPNKNVPAAEGTSHNPELTNS